MCGMGDRRSFALRITTGDAGVAVDVVARVHRGSPPPREAFKAGSRTWLYVLQPLEPEHRQSLRNGLRHVATQVEQAVPGELVVVEVESIEFAPADCPADAFAAAIIGWAADEFDLVEPAFVVEFDDVSNRYVIRY